jgi:DNA-binding transcriptional MocR family regulator
VLWIELPPGVDTTRLYRDALKHHITTAPGALFSVKDRYKNCLRMNCGLPWTDAIETALHTLGDLAKKQL